MISINCYDASNEMNKKLAMKFIIKRTKEQHLNWLEGKRRVDFRKYFNLPKAIAYKWTL